MHLLGHMQKLPPVALPNGKKSTYCTNVLIYFSHPSRVIESGWDVKKRVQAWWSEWRMTISYGKTY